jgi:hypothetical protein
VTETHNYALVAAFVDPGFHNDAFWVPREIQTAEDGFTHLCSRFKLPQIVVLSYRLVVPKLQAALFSDLVQQMLMMMIQLMV